ncbi:HAD family hydrolase [Spongiactinospora sp. TRM90649]|uniref:HAD family hydrolase n=1 Tax=Spongiactinospora sp. TRM90649 TaxID=3031114 RepID=UPI0023F67D87|nr:HAD family hydrolase [Spongiactinospora sp. TRM90649]MDF5756963.1 HAD family hydrolase [Spongiactinospora sp. TRM90649]
MLVVDFDGVVCDALAECALVTWLGAEGVARWNSGAGVLRRVPASFVRRFRKVRDYSRVLDHFVVAHLPYADWVRGRKDFDRIFRTLPAGYVSDFTRAASAARGRLRTEEPDFWLGLHTLYPGIAPLLLGQAGKTMIVTAKDERSVWDILRRHGLDGTVAEVIGECGQKAIAVRDLCRRHGISPADTTFIDDNLANVRGVAAVGVRAMWAEWGYHTPEDMANADRLGVARLPAVPAGLDL